MQGEGILEEPFMADFSRRFISVKDVAPRLGLSKITVYRMVEDGRIPSVKLGSRRLIPEAAIDSLLLAAMGASA
jgi:excisionase family DNA binding protein